MSYQVQTTQPEVGFGFNSCVLFLQGPRADDEDSQHSTASQDLGDRDLDAALVEGMAEGAYMMDGDFVGNPSSARLPGGRFINISPQEVDDIEALATKSYTTATDSQTKWAVRLFQGIIPNTLLSSISAFQYENYGLEPLIFHG